MKLWRVDDVMTRNVVTVREDTPFREVVDVLISSNVSAAPVVDGFARVLGVVSEADLLHKVEADGAPQPRIFESRYRRAERAKAGGRTAGEVMTAPAVTVPPSLALSAAARRLHDESIKRMPVVDDLGRLVGIVSRGDLLKVHLRSDADLRRDVVDEVLRRVLAVEDGTVVVETTGGVVTLRGRLDRRSAAEVAVRLARQVPGVVGVVDELRYDIDDDGPVAPVTGVPFGVA